MDQLRVNVMIKSLYNQIKMINKKIQPMKRASCQLLIPDKNCIRLTLSVKDRNFLRLDFMKLNNLIYIIIKLYRKKH